MKTETERRLEKLEANQPDRQPKNGVYIETIPGRPGEWAVWYANGQPVKAWPRELWEAL